jgi:hypothetical protein
MGDLWIHFFYGEDDWMDTSAARKMLMDGDIKGDFSIISNSGHQVTMDNSEELSLHLLCS